MWNNTFLFNFLFGTTSSTEEITAIKNSMEILKGNQDTLSNQLKQTFIIVNLTYAETNTNRLLLKSLQKDIVQVNTPVYCFSKELKVLIYDRNFLSLCPVEKSLSDSPQWIHSLKVDILSILNQISVIGSQRLTPALLNPLDLTNYLLN